MKMTALFHAVGKVNKGNLVKKLEFACSKTKSFWFLNSLCRFLAKFFWPHLMENGWCIYRRCMEYGVHKIKFSLKKDFSRDSILYLEKRGAV